MTYFATAGRGAQRISTISAFFLILASFVLSASAAQANNQCVSLSEVERMFESHPDASQADVKSTTPAAVKPLSAKDLRKAAFAAIPKFTSYFDSINERVLERRTYVDLAKLALLAEEHLLLMGPPGNAKSQFADLVLGNIKSDTGETSYFRIQMTPETTMSETHGPMDYKKLSETGAYDRLHDQGMGAKRGVFIDEIFDARANAQRNILGMLAERAHAQGAHIVKAELETAIGATNKYISEVYEQAGDDRPRAVIDRFALVAFVPANFEMTGSYVELIRRSKRAQAPIPEFKFSDLEALRAVLPQVEISEPVAKVLSLLSMRMKAETESLEAASLKSYREKVKNGEEPTVPYRATKFHSPRTIGKAASILKAIVLSDWIQKKGKRKLEATVKDLAQLQKFFTLNGPHEEFVKSEMSRTSNQHERAQLMSILQEREIFHRHYDKIVEEMDVASVKYALTDIAGVVGSARTAEEKQIAAQSVMTALAKVVTDKKDGVHSELSGAEIGKEFVQTYLEGLMKNLVTEAEFKVVRQSVLEEIERQKRSERQRIEQLRQAQIEKQRKIERDAARKLAEEKALREAEEKRQAELIEAFVDPSRFDIGTVLAWNNADPRSGNSHIAYHGKTGQLAIYHRGVDSLQLIDTNNLRLQMSATLKTDVLGTEKVQGYEVSRIEFLNETLLGFYSEKGQIVYAYDLKTSQATHLPLSMKPTALAFNEKQGITMSFDPSSLKMRILEGLNIKDTDQYTFVAKSTSVRNWTETDFKGHFNGDAGFLKIADSGEYGVLVQAHGQLMFKVDFAKKEITPIETPQISSFSLVQFNSSIDLSIRGIVGNNKTFVMDLSGAEPSFSELTTSSANLGYGALRVRGTSLLLVSRGPNVAGMQLIDGTTGTVLKDSVLEAPDHRIHVARQFADGFVFFAHNGSAFTTEIVKFKKADGQ